MDKVRPGLKAGHGGGQIMRSPEKIRDGTGLGGMTILHRL
jgi:hypothetical protein